MRLALRLSALILVGIFVYAIASEGSILGPFLLFTGKDELGDRDGGATYQGIGRSILIVAIVVIVLKALLTDMALTKVRRDLRRLKQRIALLETDDPLERDAGETPRSRKEGKASTEEPVRRSSAY